MNAPTLPLTALCSLNLSLYGGNHVTLRHRIDYTRSGDYVTISRIHVHPEGVWAEMLEWKPVTVPCIDRGGACLASLAIDWEAKRIEFACTTTQTGDNLRRLGSGRLGQAREELMGLLMVGSH